MNRRDEILDLANDLIQSVGYKGFSYADLAKKMSVTKASIHHHFPTKEDLGIAYCEKKLESLQDFRKSLAAMPLYTEQLRAYIGISRGCKGEKMCGINAMQSDMGDMPEALSNMVRKVTERELEILTEILTAGRAAGQLRFTVSPYDQAMMVSSALKGALLLSRIKHDDSFERLCNAFIETLEVKQKSKRAS